MPLQLFEIDIALAVITFAVIIMNWQLRAIRKSLHDIAERLQNEATRPRQ
jgi:hypothetical protein